MIKNSDFVQNYTNSQQIQSHHSHFSLSSSFIVLPLHHLIQLEAPAMKSENWQIIFVLSHIIQWCSKNNPHPQCL